MNFEEMSDSEILSFANPIMDDLMEVWLRVRSDISIP